MNNQSKEDYVVMQVRCIYCKKEQYGVAVYDISFGNHPCVWCGKTPPVFNSDEEYHKILGTLNKPIKEGKL